MNVAVLSDFATQRQTMVDCQIRTFDVTDQTVISRFLDVARERFVPSSLQSLVYSDAALELRAEGETRTMLAPLVLARMKVFLLGKSVGCDAKFEPQQIA